MTINKVTDIDPFRHQRALTNWLEDCNRRLTLKFPAIEFESDHWLFRTHYNTEQLTNWHFTKFFAPFHSKDMSFCDAMRGLIAETIINGTTQQIAVPARAFCLLAQLSVKSIFEITLNDLRKVEDECLIKARAHHPSAARTQYLLVLLKTQIELLADVGVIQRLGFHLRHEIKAELRKLARNHKKIEKTNRSLILDHKIEAFNDALNALYENDPRLSSADRMALAVATRLMCAPSRINEILCSAVDDHVFVEDYAQKPSLNELNSTHRAHQLLITMKGSKGASWAAKPALNFMIDAFNYTTEVIKQHSQRSRTLVEWYQQNPNSLYLPPELEYLKGENLSCCDLAKIIYQTESPSLNQIKKVRSRFFDRLRGRQLKIKRQGSRSPRSFLPFKDAENILLQKVHLAMEACRRVTRYNHYQGDLSKMLCLFDSKGEPFLPKVLSYKRLNSGLKRENSTNKPTLFEKLGITMPVNGKVEVAWIDTHDPRRWLTTQALRHGEKLSDVLINKWANRLKLAQLKAYDLRSDEELASFSKMPVVQELADISRGIERATKLEEEYGLRSQIITVPDANICVTSMDLVVQSVEDRPVARTSEQVIILYPSQFGVCLHQHHETPCRNYDSCLPCDSNVVVKGHLSSNEKVRSRAVLLHKSIIRQLDRLVMVYNRGIADDPESLAQHILTLVEKGLDSEQMADYLIDEFHQIKDLVQDKLLVKRLEEAFVARGFVKLLDDEEIPSGALMKYHNPTYHASPGLEKAINSHGGREQIHRDEQSLIEKYPQFAPKALHLKDERHLMTADGEDFEG